jgi:hypothetical protein
MGKQSWFLAVCAAVALAGCSAKRPTLYPNETYNRVGKEQADRDIAACEAQAAQYVKSGGSNNQMARDAARNTAGGAVVGAIGGNVGQGAAVGAASGATAGLVGTLLGGFLGGGSGPDPVYASFVDTCLREKGYQPVGWQ